jgi:hypothetical protein
MKTALCATSIHPLTSFKLLRACSTEVKFFVACDQKTAIDVYENEDLLTDIMSPNQQMQLGYKCSEACGWNTMSRRNIAFLEALKWGAGIVVAHDVDNFPINKDYFWDFGCALTETFDGIEVTGRDHWFDAGAYLRPPAKHRGIPIQHQHRPIYKPVTDRKVGVAAGLILNDPDVDAVTRIALAPDSQQVSLLADAGMVVDLYTWTTFNTQSVAMLRELVPAWFLFPNVGRMDDIYSSLVVQRVARERELHVHFGKPFAIQQRHEHNLIADLRAEIDGYENVAKLADLLDHIVLPGKSVVEDVYTIYSTLEHSTLVPKDSVKAGFYWLEDCEGVL